MLRIAPEVASIGPTLTHAPAAMGGGVEASPSRSNNEKQQQDHPPATEEALLSPFTYVCSLGSKGFRGQLIDALNEWLQLPSAVVGGVKACIDMLHNASLLIDDIEDNSDLRRGAPSAHCVFGVPLTINCANQVYFMALQKILALPSVAVASSSSSSSSSCLSAYYLANLPAITMSLSTVFTEEMICLHQGQGMDILWRDTHRCPTMDEYDEMVLKKTGGLFRLALRLMMTLAPPPSSSRMVGEEEDVVGDASDASLSPSLSQPSTPTSSTPAAGVSSNHLKASEVLAAAVTATASAVSPSPSSSSSTPSTSHSVGYSIHSNPAPLLFSSHHHRDTNGVQHTYSPIPLERRCHYIALVETMGVFFQTLDDYLNVSSEAYHSNKSFFEDLSEGKFSYPIIHSILKHKGNEEQGNEAIVGAEAEAGNETAQQHRPIKIEQATQEESLPTLLQVLKQRPKDVATKRYCVGLLESTGSMTATRARIDALKQAIYDRLDVIAQSQTSNDNDRAILKKGERAAANDSSVTPTQTRSTSAIHACIAKMCKLI